MPNSKKLHTKFGDTLIEVTLAIGIFSLVAVAIVSVVSTSTSSAQVALESTLAREEIDNQAEALRFIQSSYVNSAVYSKPDEESEYQTLWKAITDNAKTKEQVTDDILLFHPSTCDELYEGGNLINQSAFIINTRNLSSTDVDQIVLPAKTASVFYPAETYPHLIYGTLQDDQPLYDESDEETNLLRASGIYVIAVKDPDSTNIVSGNVRKVSKGAAYYDFYIRACWYAPGAEQPTTISTVIRLYDPGAIEVKGPTLTYKVVFKPNGASATDKTQVVNRDEPTNLSANSFSRSGYKFKGWNTMPDGSGTTYADKAQVNNLAEANKVYDLYAQWERTEPACDDGTLALQGWTGAGSLSQQNTTILCDNRDGQKYTVAKLKDGKVWMIDNLNLGDPKYPLKTNLTSSNTNLSTTITKADFSGWTYNESTYRAWETPIYTIIAGTDSNSKTKYGAIYTFCAATAKTKCSRYHNETAVYDLCPAGWRLPNLNEIKNLANKYTGKLNASVSAGGAAFARAGNGIYNLVYNTGLGGWYYTSYNSGLEYDQYYHMRFSNSWGPYYNYQETYYLLSLRCLKK